MYEQLKDNNISCPVCNSKAFKKTGEPEIEDKSLGFIRHNYFVAECSACNYYFVNPPIDFSIQEWNKLYGDSYFPQMTAWHKKQRVVDAKKRLDWIKSNCNFEIKNFLDVGCGEGLALVEADSRGWSATGIDITDNRIEPAKKDGIKFINADLISSRFPGKYFDCAYMDSVLEHLTDPVAYLIELNRILKRNGVVYIGVPNEDSLFNIVKRILYNLTGKKNISSKIKPFMLPYHVGGFNKKSIIKIAQVTNFKVAAIHNFASRFEFRKYKPSAKGFWLHLFLLPVDLLAIILRREAYYEALLKKQ